MVKASMRLPNGTVVQIEGSPSEVKQLLQFYGGDEKPAELTPLSGTVTSASSNRKSDKPSSSAVPNLAEIVNLVKSCEEAEKIEKNILDRSSQVDRTLLPMFVINRYLKNSVGLSSGDINRITTELGVPVSTPNASTTLSGTASKYVIGDRLRKHGQPVRYKLSRRGMLYIEAVIAGEPGEK